eukprot:2348826-Amphidinium_carterae.1
MQAHEFRNCLTLPVCCEGDGQGDLGGSYSCGHLLRMCWLKNHNSQNTSCMRDQTVPDSKPSKKYVEKTAHQYS